MTRADCFYTGVARWTIRFRWLTIIGGVLLLVLFASAITDLRFSMHFRDMFSPVNPELIEYNEFVDEYLEPVNISFVVHAREGNVYTVETLHAIAELTESAWQLPFVNRVDSLSNYQHTWVEDDELIVAALVEDPDLLDVSRAAQIEAIATSELLVLNRLVSNDGRAAIVIANNAFSSNKFEDLEAAVLGARELANEIQSRHPQIKIALGGFSVVNFSTFTAAMYDMPRLIPAMLVLMLLVVWVGLRSASMTLGVFVVILASSIMTVGTAGLIGFQIDAITSLAPIIVMTLAVADSVHILLTMRGSLGDGLDKNAALIEAIRSNFAPIAITSLTTGLGFLSITAADAPPLQHLGYITAAGVMAAWAYSILVLPALISLLPVNSAMIRKGRVDRSMKFAAWLVISHYGKVLLICTLFVAGLAAAIPKLELNNQFAEYISPRMQSRQDLDFTRHFFSIDTLEYSVPAGSADGINNPEYLKRLDNFAAWLREQDGVESVYSISDIVKRLNQNLNAGDPDFYRIPDSAEAAAQYLLLYELSLPFGLDLNDRFNIDKSASRLTVSAQFPGTREGTALIENSRDWMQANLPEQMVAEPTGIYVMFAHMAKRNLEAMVGSTGLLLLAIGLIMALGLRSFSLGAMSLLPTCLPIVAALGIWALLVGEAGLSVSIVAAVSLGIIVDNAVHLMSKFVRAQRKNGLNAEQSLNHTFETVGVAIFYNTVILTAGFVMLMASVYRTNVEMGALTAIAIVTAFVLDFLMLPAMMLVMRDWAPRFTDKIIGQPSVPAR